MAIVLADPDGFAAASGAAMAANLTAPFAGGARTTELPIDAAGGATVGWNARQPLLLAAVRDALADTGLELDATLAGAPATVLPTLRFAPYTEARAQLPLHLPPVDTATGEAAAFSLTLTATAIAADGARTPLAAAELNSVFTLEILEGILGRLLYIAGAEKQRVRRQALEIQAARQLAAAGADALDRIGADLGVPRFLDQLTFDGGAGQIVALRGAQPETDADYRRRLALYRPLRRSTLGSVTELLNGPGDATDANRGPLSELAPALGGRFSVTDSYSPLAVAVHLVGAGDDEVRAELLEYIRATLLLWPGDDVDADDVHGARFLPAAEKDRIDRARTALRTGYVFAGDAAVDPALAGTLADALIRVAQVRAALGSVDRWAITRTQADAGNRYELGLGADLTLPSPAELDQLQTALAAPGRAPAADAETEALLRSMAPQTSAADPEGRWLLGPCGLRTVQRLDATTIYVSHLPTFGLVIDAPSQAPLNGWTALVPGQFGLFGGAGLFAYQRAAGIGQFFGVWEGEMVQLGPPITGLPTTWTEIVSGSFGQPDGLIDAIACYDATQGQLECHAWTAGTNLLAPVGAPWRGLSRTVGALVTGDFGAPGHTNLALYDPADGTTSLFDGNFNALSLIGSPGTDVGPGYTTVVAGRFGPDDTSTLLFYDRTAGRGAFYGLDWPGRLRPIAEHHDWQPGWSHVVAGFFYTGTQADLLFYDRDDATAELYTTDGEGNLTLIASPDDWHADWTHVIPGAWEESGYSSLLLYNVATSRAEFDLFSNQLTLEQFGATTGPPTAAIDLEGHYFASESQDSNVVLEAGLTAALAAWQASGGEAPTRLAPADATTAWGLAAVNDQVRQALEDAGLPNVPDPAGLAAALGAYPSDLLATLTLGPTMTAAVIAGAGTDQVRALIGELRDHDLPAAVGFATSDGRVLIVVAVIGLPVAGLNLSERTATGFRWYSVPLVGMRPTIGASGSRTTLTAADRGVSAVVLLAYARQGDLPDPYQFTVDLPSGDALSLEQYEFLMNALELACPAGVSVNTYSIRQRHVALDGTVTPLGPGLSSTYRPFRRRRSRGSVAAADSLGAAPIASATWTRLGGEVLGGIAPILDSHGAVRILTRRGDGTVSEIHQLQPGGAEFSDWLSLGGAVIGPVVAAPDRLGMVDVFARAADGSIAYAAQSADGWGPWQQAASPPGELLAAGRSADGEVILAASRQDASVWLAFVQAAPPWGAWQATNGNAAGLLVMGTNADGRLELFCRGLDQALWHLAQTAPAGGWGNWSSLGASIRDGLAVAANADGRLQAFVCGLDGGLSTIAQTSPGGPWGAWSSLGGRLGGAVAAVANADGTLHVFASAADNTVTAIAQQAPNGGWGPWVSLGGAVSDYLAAIRGSDGRIELFTRGWDNELWHARQLTPNGGWGS